MNRLPLFVTALLGVAMPLVFDSALKGLALLLAAALAALALWRASASARHLVWLVAVIALMIVPVLSVALPRWRVLPDWAVVTPPVPVPAPVLEESAAPAPPPVLSYNTAVPPASALPVPSGPEPAPAALPEHTASPPVVTASPARSFSPVPLETSVSGAWPLVWLGGCGLLLARLAVARWYLRRAARRCTPAGSGPLRLALQEAATRLGLKQSVRLLLDGTRAMPVVWGIFRPRLVLPAGAGEWDPAQLRSVLLHELAHIRRRDTAVQWLTQCACALHWFNPLVWIAAWRLHVERERACDDLVLSSGVLPSDYAGHLLQVATRFTPAPWTAACGLAMARKSRLEGRLVAVLSDKLSRRRVNATFAAAALLMAAALAIPLAMLRAGEREKEAAVSPPAPAPTPTPTPTASSPATALSASPEPADSLLFDDTQAAYAVQTKDAVDFVLYHPGFLSTGVSFSISGTDGGAKQWKFEGPLQIKDVAAFRTTGVEKVKREFKVLYSSADPDTLYLDGRAYPLRGTREDKLGYPAPAGRVFILTGKGELLQTDRTLPLKNLQDLEAIGAFARVELARPEIYLADRDEGRWLLTWDEVHPARHGDGGRVARLRIFPDGRADWSLDGRNFRVLLMTGAEISDLLTRLAVEHAVPEWRLPVVKNGAVPMESEGLLPSGDTFTNVLKFRREGKLHGLSVSSGPRTPEGPDFTEVEKILTKAAWVAAAGGREGLKKCVEVATAECSRFAVKITEDDLADAVFEKDGAVILRFDFRGEPDAKLPETPHGEITVRVPPKGTPRVESLRWWGMQLPLPPTTPIALPSPSRTDTSPLSPSPAKTDGAQEGEVIVDVDGTKITRTKSPSGERIGMEFALDKLLEGRIKITDEEVEKWLAAHPEAAKTAGRVKLRSLTMPSQKRDEKPGTMAELAKTVHAALVRGEDFATLARKHSADSKQASGGDWGWVGEDDLDAAFWPIVSKIRAGTLSDVIPMGGNFYIFKVEATEDPRVRSPEELKTFARRRLQVEDEAARRKVNSAKALASTSPEKLRRVSELLLMEAHFRRIGDSTAAGKSYREALGLDPVRIIGSGPVTPLMIAAASGDPAEVKRLLAAGEDPNARTADTDASGALVGGMTPLMLACLMPREDHLQPFSATLLEDPLPLASLQGREDVAKALLEGGAKVALARTANKRFPLFEALAAATSENAAVRLLTILLDHGADVNEPEGHIGSTLHLAATRDWRKVMRLLVSRGASLEIKTRTGQTPAALLRAAGKTEVADFLESLRGEADADKRPQVRKRDDWSPAFQALSRHLAEARGLPEAKPDDLIAWGPEKDGLRAGLLMGTSVREGTPLPAMLVLRNLSAQPRDLKVVWSWNATKLAARDAGGKDLQVTNLELFGVDLQVPLTLQPNEQIEMTAPPVQFGGPAPKGLSIHTEAPGSVIRARFRLTFVPGVETGEIPVTVTGTSSLSPPEKPVKENLIAPGR